MSPRVRVADVQPWITAGVLDEAGWPGQWLTRSGCSPDDAKKLTRATTKAARKVCAGCPVKDWCLAYAVVTDNREGMWGGQTPKRRGAITGLPLPSSPDVVLAVGRPRRVTRAELLDPPVSRLLEQGLDSGQIAARLGETMRVIQQSIRRIRAVQAGSPQAGVR